MIALQPQNARQPDLAIARRFLTLLSQCDENDEFTFQTFPEQKGECKGYPEVSHGLFADLESKLVTANRNGSGIFVTINRTDGKGRKSENIVGIRAIFVDLDGSPLQPVQDAPLTPHMIIQSSPDRYHAYWIVEGITCDEFTSIQKEIAARFRGDPKVVDLSRVMRLPGFYHLKEAPYQSTIINESGEPPFTREHFLETFKITKAEGALVTESQIVFSDPVLQALQRNKLLIRQQGHPAGCWTIRCPWENLHSKQDHGTKYFEPNNTEYPRGGFKCFHAHCAGKSLKDLLAYLGVEGVSSSSPLPLHRLVEAPQRFPINALGTILGAAALAIQRIVQAPDAICAQSVLGAAALACQPFANISIDGREIVLSLFLITIAESGDRKSATDKIALKPIYEWQRMLSTSFIEENNKYVKHKELWECKKKEWLKDPSKGEFKEDQPPAPLHPLVLVEEPTYEGIVKYLAIGQPSIGIFSDEGSRFFGGHAMSRDNQLKTIGGLSSLWDGKEISRLRGGDGNMLLFGRRTSMHLMIQEPILEQLMSNKMIEYQGFLPRCLISFPETTAGKRPYVEEDISKDPAIIKYNNHFNLMLDTKLPVAPYPAPQNELIPRKIILTKEAKAEWVLYHNAIDQELAPGGRLEPIRRFSNKAAEHVLRLAGILAMTENINTQEIGVEYIGRAIVLVEYYLTETMRIQSCLSIDPDLLLAKKVLNWCWEKGRSIFSLQEIYQCGPAQIRQASKARSIMSLLESHGWATSTPSIEIEGKYHKEAWTVRHQS